MSFVRTLWRRDVQRHIDENRDDEAVKDGSRKRICRPRKCWHCFQKHVDGSSVCPMAREEPVEWREMTKEVKSVGYRGVCVASV